MTAPKAFPLADLLCANDSRTYYMWYGGFLSNHILHGIVALDKLGASRDLVDKFIIDYRERLERPDEFLKEEPPTTDLKRSEAEPGCRIPEKVLGQLKGTGKCYYALLRHYEDLLETKYGGSLEDCIRGEWPKLHIGMIASAFHGLIHTGYGYEAHNAKMVCEGLAKIHSWYSPLNLSCCDAALLGKFGLGEVDILDVVDHIREDHELRDFMVRESQTEKWAHLDCFHRRADLLLTCRSERLLHYVNQIKFPQSIHLDKLDNPEEIQKVSTWLTNCAIVVYAITTRKNDFFLLHGVTSSWSLMRILRLLGDKELVISTVRVYLCALFATYLLQNSPVTDRSILQVDESTVPSWQAVVDKALGANERENVHIYKLVQVCQYMHERADDDAMDKTYRLACSFCVDNPFTYE